MSIRNFALGCLAAAVLAVVLLPALHSREAAAAEGFYAGTAIGFETTGVDYTKSVIYSSPASATSDGDKAQDWVSSVKVMLGHRWNLPGKTYFAGELDMAFKVKNRVNGFIDGQAGSTAADPDVFPGHWFLDKNYGAGFSAKVGYSPEGLIPLGEGGSIYAVGGIRRTYVEVEAGHEGTLDTGVAIEGKEDAKLAAWPWLVGGGVEIGSKRDRVDVRVTYSSYDVNFSQGAGTAADPGLDYRFDVGQWGFYLGYVRSFGFGIGI